MDGRLGLIGRHYDCMHVHRHSGTFTVGAHQLAFLMQECTQHGYTFQKPCQDRRH